VRKEVLQRVKEKRNNLQAIKRKKANWIGHNLCRQKMPSKTLYWRKNGRDGKTSKNT
jgi:hypothetical protein